MSADLDTTFKVIIIGAGPAGLLLAQALQKEGIQCTVYERDAAIDARAKDWSFGIYWAQVPLNDCLPDEIVNLLTTVTVDSRLPSADDFLPFYNGLSGELLKNLPTPFMLRLRRQNFRKLLSRGIDIQFGKRLARAESDGNIARAIFDDGTTATGNLLVSAEGAHSKVRELVLGKDEAALQMTPLACTMTMAKLPKETALLARKLHPRFCGSVHPDNIFLWMVVHDAYDGTNPGDWMFMFLMTWPIPDDYDANTVQGQDILDDMKRRVEVFGEPFRSIVKSIPDGIPAWHNRLSYWTTRPWDNKNCTVTLLGDAAHPMTFHRGQGLNNAIHDVASFVRQLHLSNGNGNHNHNGNGHDSDEDRNSNAAAAASNSTSTAKTKRISHAAIKGYESEVQERGREAVLSSLENSLLVHDWPRLWESPLMKLGIKQKGDDEVVEVKG